MLFWKQKYLAVKVTLASLVGFFLFVFVILLTQYSIVNEREMNDFERNAETFFTSYERENISEKLQNLENDKRKKLENIDDSWLFMPFETGNFTLSEALVYRLSDGFEVVNELIKFKNSEEFFSPFEDSSKILSIKEWKVQIIRLYDADFWLYRKNIGDYSVFYYNYTLNFFTYYSLLFLDFWYIFVLIGVSFLALSLYFSQLVVRPIREKNISLAMYNHNLAHEIKTPLAVISSNFDMFDLTKNPKFITSSREELSHIEYITNSLLFLVDAKNNTDNFIETDIISIIENILPKFSFLKIEKNFSKEQIVKIIDPHLFVSLIKNILQNAFKYSSDKSVKIIIDKGILIFENNISETISQKELEKIEEIFYQMDKSRGFEGYGLGIPMMRKIVQNFGWKMKISSRDKKIEIKIFL